MTVFYILLLLFAQVLFGVLFIATGLTVLGLASIATFLCLIRQLTQ